MEEALADSATATMKNQCASLKRAYPVVLPEAIREQMRVRFDALSCLSYQQKGRRARLIYLKAGASDQKPPQSDEIYIADFVLQENGWRVLPFLRKTDAALIAKIKAGDMKFLEEAEYSVPDEVPAVPALLPEADYVAYLHYMTPGFKVTVTINGVPHECSDTSGATVILGGLKKGSNVVNLQYEHKPGTPTFSAPGVQIRVKASDKTQRQFFAFKWESGTGEHEERLELDDQKLKELPEPAKL